MNVKNLGVYAALAALVIVEVVNYCGWHVCFHMWV